FRLLFWFQHHHEKHIFKTLDNELANTVNLKWLPWTGLNYEKTQILILGESQYEDGDKWQENNLNATRFLIATRFLGHRAKILTNVERVLFRNDSPSEEQAQNLWESVIYFNLVQRLMKSIKERPSDADFDMGWAVFFDLVKLLRPKHCLVLGRASRGRLGAFLSSRKTGWIGNASDFLDKRKTINLTNEDHFIKLTFINHPSGSRGFKHEFWADLIRKNDPDLSRIVATLNT
ncbi:MAG: uracil-DNA glycosylase family protein, partial [Cyclobacteriaceae bacterium]|nr:uracil-DNA glycosylase family protein [Cyclobacteriaceae bacterium]